MKIKLKIILNNVVKDSKKKAIEKNIELAKETGNKLTQSINEQGKLVGVSELNTQENVFKEQGAMTIDEVKHELFEK